MGTIAAGSSVNIIIEAELDTLNPKIFTVNAEVESDTLDPMLDNNNASLTITVQEWKIWLPIMKKAEWEPIS